jgi:hypothetical protein
LLLYEEISPIVMLSETICFVLQEDDTSSVYTECEEPDQLFSLPPIRDEWRTLFDMFDPEGFGEIPLDDFEVALDSREFITNISPGKIIILKVTRNRITLKKFHQYTVLLSKEFFIKNRTRAVVTLLLFWFDFS